VAVPGFTADATLPRSKAAFVRRARRSPSVAQTWGFTLAQGDPCALTPSGGGGGGGGGPKPKQCAAGQRCCEPAPGGGCFLCAPVGAQCP